MKIAIVGSGIAGLTCAYLLNRQHDIQVFEASDWIGGHTHTVDVEVQGRSYAIDTGFIVFNDWTYPNFVRLLGQVGVGFKPTEMSFSVSDPTTGVEYNGHDLNTLFAQRSNLLSPAFWGMLRDILRFNRQSLNDLANNRIDADTTLGQYLERNGYGRRFIEHYIVPMGSAIWSMSLADMLGFPLQFFVRFCKNHGLLSVSDRPTWQVIEGGSRSYVAPLTASFAERIRLNCPVSRVVRDQDGVTLHSAAGSERFDKVIFACHSDQALALLDQASEKEWEILGALPYANNDVVLHTDTRLLPKRKLAWASWNYRLGGPCGSLQSVASEGQARRNPARERSLLGVNEHPEPDLNAAWPSAVALQRSADQMAAVTYNMNILQGIDSDTTFCVSLNQTAAIDPSKILARFQYAHPQYSLAGTAAQARWEELLGAQHSYYCGAYWANGFHEDGVVSALRVARAFGETL
ncbi:FAD-dependent oxidoreductase [Pseudomonas sp. o96-267]|uniref:NAD(P)/FAD-dependent oxidoreductase n=1 Tax=Pseudomonas sp. o96-267 TaxID=2479853 RepID=UPI002113B219